MVAIVAHQLRSSLPCVVNILPVLHIIRLLSPSILSQIFCFTIPLWIPLNAVIGRTTHPKFLLGAITSLQYMLVVYVHSKCISV